MKLQKRKCKVLHLAEAPCSTACRRLGQLESSLVERYLGILVTSKWNMIQQCALVRKKTNSIQTASVKILPADQGS